MDQEDVSDHEGESLDRTSPGKPAGNKPAGNKEVTIDMLVSGNFIVIIREIENVGLSYKSPFRAKVVNIILCSQFAKGWPSKHSSYRLTSEQGHRRDRTVSLLRGQNFVGGSPFKRRFICSVQKIL